MLMEGLLAGLGESAEEEEDLGLSCYQDILAKTSFGQLEIIK